MQKIYKKVFLIGHSLGATAAISIADKKTTGVVLWDPPHKAKISDAISTPIHPKFYTLDWGTMFLVSKQYARDISTATYYRSTYAHVPTLLVRAANNTEGWSFDKVPAQHILIPNSDHSFHKEGTEKLLFKETLKFIHSL